MDVSGADRYWMGVRGTWWGVSEAERNWVGVNESGRDWVGLSECE